MNINSITATSFASSVWVNATRTLTADPTLAGVADAVTNVTCGDVVGNKTDTPVATGTAANGTLSVASYIKALWNKLRSITFTNLDATISSRASAAAALTTVIASMQYGTITLSSASSATATITSVNTAKARLGLLGMQSDQNTLGDADTRITLTNATTVTATKQTANGTIVVSFVVTEYI